MAYINQQDLQAAVAEINAEINAQLASLVKLRPKVSRNVKEKDAKRFCDGACEAWVRLNDETIEQLNEAMNELQLEDYGETFVDKILHLIEGMELLNLAIDGNCAEPIPMDAGFDEWKNYIRF